ncbi:MAG TPA: hypothetical protein PK324_23865, partial [Nocardioides sp.]|nr:hypothetical protein [Nocardioides sp.]
MITIMDVEASHDTVSDYLLAHSSPQDDVLARLAEETRTSFGGVSEMQITADEGALLTLLTRLVGAAYTIEVGTFTGYSSICIARGLAPGGRLLACDVSGEWTDLARRYWDEAGVTLTESGGKLTGTKSFVLDGHTANLILVLAKSSGGGLALFLAIVFLLLAL